MGILGDEFRGRWSAIGRSRQRVLRAIAVDGSPLAQAAQAAFGVTKGSVKGAVQDLHERGEIEQAGYGILDPLLGRRLCEKLGGPSGEVT